MIDMNHKEGTMTLRLSRKMFNVEQASGLTKKQKEKLKGLIKDEVKMIKHHFKHDGWDLDFDMIRSDVIYNLIGADFFAIFAAEVLHATKGKIDVVLDKRFMLSDPNYKPVYMNKRTGKIIVCENSRSAKKYINNNYEDIGTL